MNREDVVAVAVRLFAVLLIAVPLRYAATIRYANDLDPVTITPSVPTR